MEWHVLTRFYVYLLLLCILHMPTVATDTYPESTAHSTFAMASSESSDGITSEIQSLKEKYGSQCRVLTGVGEFTHVINFQPANKTLNIKFQIAGGYPKVCPVVMVRCSSLSQENNSDLVTHLESIASQNTDKELVGVLITSALIWIDENGIDISDRAVKHKSGKKPKSKKKEKEIVKDDSEEEDAKKPSMKTAIDVIKRIQWDESLPQDEFLVGYIDRFCGIQEKYFTAFSWEDIASVDYNVLAVPKHRIEYFKYKNIKVWDKPTRLDNVFGSCGSNRTITDVIEEYEAQQAVKRSGNDETRTKHSSDESSDDDDDSDDDIVVTCNATGFDHDKIMNDDGNDVGSEEKVPWQNKLRPNHFIAIRLSDDSIRRNIKEVQDFINKHQPLYKDCCIPQAALHVTLTMLGLDTPEQVANAASALQSMRSELKGMLRRVKPLKLDGVSHFYNRVVYSKVEKSPEFLEFVDHLKLCLRESGIAIRDGYDFIPHATIMKVSRPVTRKMGTSSIDPLLYSGFSDKYFGKQAIDKIYLCIVGDQRQSDGFYVCPAVVDLS